MPNPLDVAYARAKTVYKAPGFRSAYMNGARAAHAKKPLDSCPYPEGSKRRGWGDVFRKAWVDGYLSMDPRRRST